MEDFVPFELAKKLKEKGFKEKCLTYYDVEDNVGLLYNTQYTDESFPCQYTDLLQCHNTGKAETQPDDSEDCVDAPTISQVLKWLRNEKKISIQPLSVRGGTWEAQITFTDDNDVTLKKMFEDKSFWTDDRFTSYEQAAFAGIEYVIDNML